MSVALKKRWAVVTPDLIADAIYKSVKCSGELLKQNPRLKTSIWGKIAATLFKHSKLVDRFWLYVCYRNNTGGTKELYQNLCLNKDGVDVTGPTDEPPLDDISVHCFCRNPFSSLLEFSMVECDGCSFWYHCICVGEKAKKLEDVVWKCPACAGNHSVPPIFSDKWTGQGMPLTDSAPSDKGATSTPVGSPTPLNFQPTPTAPNTSRRRPVRPAGNVSAKKSVPSDHQKGRRGVTLQQRKKLFKQQVNSTGAQRRGNIEEDAQSLGKRSEVSFCTDTDAGSGSSSNEHILAHHNNDTISDTESQSDTTSAITTPITQHKEFNIVIPMKEWNNIKPKLASNNSAKGYRYRMKKTEWAHVFNDQFIKVMPGCSLVFEKHVVNESGRGMYVNAKAYCSRGLCSMVYKFVVQKEPKPASDCKVLVRPQGTLVHDIRIPAKRFLSGPKRVAMKKELKETRPSALLTKKYADKATNRKALNEGNITEVQTLEILRKARQELLSAGDHHASDVYDLALTKLELDSDERFAGKVMSGYVQRIGYHPFSTMMVTELQLHLLHRLLRLPTETVLHLDATGGIISKLAIPFSQKRVFYYAVVATVPDPQTSAIPLAEFITNEHNVVSISNFLQSFLHMYREAHATNRPSFGIMRFETDFSLALISSVINSTENGPVLAYLRAAWAALVSRSRRSVPMVLHICRSHVVKFLHKNIQKYYKQQVLVTNLKKWVYGYVYGKDLWSFCRRVVDICLLVGRKYQTQEVLDVLDNMDNRTSREGTQGWSIVDVQNLQNHPPMKLASPFGYFAIKFCELQEISLIEETGNDSDSEPDQDTQTPNPYYCVKFLNYLLTDVIPFSPLLDHSLLHLNNYSLHEDTNAASESWNKILKVDEHPNILPTRIGRFIRRHADVMHGRLLRFELGLRRVEAHYHTMRGHGTLPKNTHARGLPPRPGTSEQHTTIDNDSNADDTSDPGEQIYDAEETSSQGSSRSSEASDAQSPSRHDQIPSESESEGQSDVSSLSKEYRAPSDTGTLPKDEKRYEHTESENISSRKKNARANRATDHTVESGSEHERGRPGKTPSAPRRSTIPSHVDDQCGSEDDRRGQRKSPRSPKGSPKSTRDDLSISEDERRPQETPKSPRSSTKSSQRAHSTDQSEDDKGRYRDQKNSSREKRAKSKPATDSAAQSVGDSNQARPSGVRSHTKKSTKTNRAPDPPAQSGSDEKGGSTQSASGSPDIPPPKSGRKHAEQQGKSGSGSKEPVPEAATENWGKRSKSSTTKRDNVSLNSVNLIPWGGRIDFGGTQHPIVNTCSFDNQLQMIYMLYKTHPATKVFLDTWSEIGDHVASQMLKIFQRLDSGNFSDAKRIWITHVLRISGSGSDEKNMMSGNFFGSEENFLNSISHFVPIIQMYHCANPVCVVPREQALEIMKDVLVKHPRSLNRLFNSTKIENQCSGCGTANVRVSLKFTATGPPPFLAFSLPSGPTTRVTGSEIPVDENLKGHKYSLFGYTIRHADHFITVLHEGKKKYIYDGLSAQKLKKFNERPGSVNTIWYKLE